MTGDHKFHSDIGITLVASLINMIIGFVVTVVLARMLGSDDLGIYRIASTYYAFAIGIAGLGIPAAVVKYVASEGSVECSGAKIASSGLIISVIAGIAASITMWLLSETIVNSYGMPELLAPMRTMALAIPFSTAGASLLAFLNGQREMRKYSNAVIVQSVLMMIFSVGLISLGLGVHGVTLAVLLSSIGYLGFIFITLRGQLVITLRGFADRARMLISFGWKILSSNLVNQVNYQLDILLLGALVSASSIGCYGAAVGLSRFIWILPSSIQTVTYPLSSELWAKHEMEQLRKALDKVTRLTSILVLPTCIAIISFSNPIVRLLFGPDFEDSILPLQILIVGSALFSLLMAIGGTLQAIGRPDLSLRAGIVTAAANITMNAVLIPTMGIVGAAIASTGSAILGTFLVISLIEKTAHITIVDMWHVKSIATFVVALAITMTLGMSGLLTIPVSIVIACGYAFFMLLVIADRDDLLFARDTLRAILGRRGNEHR